MKTKFVDHSNKEDYLTINQLFISAAKLGSHIFELCIFVHEDQAYAGHIRVTFIFMVFMIVSQRTICLIKKLP